MANKKYTAFNFIGYSSKIKFLMRFFGILMIMSTSIYAEAKNTFKKIETRSDLYEILDKLSDKEKEYLTNFFKYTFFFSTFGYVIFGDKPMSFETIDKTYDPIIDDRVNYMDISSIFNRYKLRECWETWLKYSTLFELKNYKIIYYNSTLDPNYIEIAVVNCSNFLKTIEQHLINFHSVLEKKLNPNEILDEYLKGQGDVFNKIRNHDGLFGTLLGYGYDNSWEFMKQKGGEKMDGNYPSFFDEPKNLSSVMRPTFKVNDIESQENKQLRENYEKQRKEINKIFTSSNFLEILLIKICNLK